MKVRRRFVARDGDHQTDVAVESRDGRRMSVRIGKAETVADVVRLPDGRASVILPSGRQLTGRATPRSDGGTELRVRSDPVRVDLADPLRDLARESDHGAAAARDVRAQIPGRVVEVRVTPGDVVAKGTTLIVLEAMKMQNEIRAGAAARVAAIECAPGQAVEKDELLVRLDAIPVS